MVIFLMCLSAHVLANSPPVIEEVTCKELGEKLRSCSPAMCRVPHPAQKDFIVTHTINGLLDDGKCHHTQTLPGGGEINCKYTKTVRLVMAKQLEGAVVVSQEDQEMLSLAFQLQCTVAE